MVKLIDKHYKGQCCQRIEEYLIDTDSELQDLPKAPAGSYTISVESGKKFYVNSSGEWPEDPSKYTGAGGVNPEGTISITENGTHDVTEYASAEVMVQSGDGWDVLDALIAGSITEITSNAENINSHAFAYCSKLTKASFPNFRNTSSTAVGSLAFSNCSNLTSISIPLATNVGSKGVFYQCTKLTDVDFPLVTTLGWWGNGTDAGTFAKCTSLESINLPSVKTIADYVFSACSSLKEVYAPLVERLGDYVFESCASLTKLDFPMLKTMDNSVFNRCYNFNTLILRMDTVCTIGNGSVFNNTPFMGYNGLRGTVYVPQALIEEYKVATNWSSIYAQGFCDFLPIEGSEYE